MVTRKTGRAPGADGKREEGKKKEKKKKIMKRRTGREYGDGRILASHVSTGRSHESHDTRGTARTRRRDTSSGG